MEAHIQLNPEFCQNIIDLKIKNICRSSVSEDSDFVKEIIQKRCSAEFGQ
jgi:hypothetical protein